jgi:predicted transcriptional regulator
MESGEGIERLLFDLASESRLGILMELKEKNLKMNEIGRKLDLTATEAFRQLQRLSEAKLIQKLPEGTYAITQYGKLTLQLLPSLSFIFMYKEYFLNHDIWRLPYSFVNRIGELSQATLSMDTIENVNKAAHIVGEAEKYVWGIGDRALESIGPAMAQRISMGVKFKFMFQECMLPIYKPVSGEAQFIEKRTLMEIPGMIFCTEKEAGICLPTTEGRMDYAGFFSKDQQFVNWTSDLFLYYWEKGKRCFPT